MPALLLSLIDPVFLGRLVCISDPNFLMLMKKQAQPSRILQFKQQNNPRTLKTTNKRKHTEGISKKSLPRREERR